MLCVYIVVMFQVSCIQYICIYSNKKNECLVIVTLDDTCVHIVIYHVFVYNVSTRASGRTSGIWHGEFKF